MKKLIVMLLSVLLVFSLSVMALADGTTTLTTNVPTANYTLSIPAGTAIAYGKEDNTIGTITVEDAENFAEGKNIEVTVTYTAFKNAAANDSIPIRMEASYYFNSSDSYTQKLDSGTVLTFKGNASGTVDKLAAADNGGAETSKATLEGLHVLIDSADWGKASAGDYTATITFTSEVVKG